MSASSDLQAVFDRGVVSLYQPIVDLDLQEVVGYEALSRGPQDSPLASPVAMFAAAAELDRLRDLDWLCRSAAVDGARTASFRHPLSLFVNAEPAALGAAGDRALWESMNDLRCFAEVTERALAGDPAGLLRAIDQVREADWGIALDDIGANPVSLALVPAVRPDVLKLDISLLQGEQDLAVTRVLHAVLAEAQASGAVVVAEGIETEQHLELASSWGVRLGQGYLLGRPAPLPDPLIPPRRAIGLVTPLIDQSVLRSPYAMANCGGISRRLSTGAVFGLIRQLEDQAASMQPAPLLLASYATAEQYDELSRLRHKELAAGLPLLGVLGPAGLPGVAPGTVFGSPGGRDPASHDWTLLVLGAHYAAAMVSRPTTFGRTSDVHDVVLTFDRTLVARAAHALLARLGTP